MITSWRYGGSGGRERKKLRLRCVRVWGVFAAVLLCLAFSGRGTAKSPAPSAAPLPAPAHEDRGNEVRIGVLANRGGAICLTEWGATADYLTRQLPPKRFRVIPLDFSEVESAVADGAVDFVLVNPSIYVNLEYKSLVYRIATFQHASLAGEAPLPVFGGVVFCRSDRSDLKTLRDVKGQRFAAVSPNSMGGWHAVRRELKVLGIDPGRDFAALSFVGTHDGVVRAVRSGKADAGTVRSTQLERMIIEGIITRDEFKVLPGPYPPPEDYPFHLSTRLYPEWPFSALRETDLELVKAVASALLRMPPDSPAARVARGAGWTVPLDYASVHECLKDLRFPPYEHYGEVTLEQAVSQYWTVVLSIGVVIVAMALLGTLAWRTSVRLGESVTALGESERNYRGVVENIRDVFYRVDMEGRIRLISPSAARLLGYDSADELVGLKADSLWADPPARAALVEILARDGHVRDYEFEAVRRDGSRLMASATIQEYRAEDGSLLGYEGIWRDVTERKRAQNLLFARLRLSDFARTHSMEELLRRTVDEAEGLTGSRIGFFHFLDPDQGNIHLQTWSSNTLARACTAEASEEHYPVERAGVWTDCIHERGPVIHNDFPALAHRKGYPAGHPEIRRELVVPILRDNRIMALLGVGNKDGPYDRHDIETLSQLSNLAWDIVQGKQAEEALRESEKRFHSLFNNMAEGVVLNQLVADKAGRPVDYRVVDCNPRYEQLTGCDRREIIGKLATEIDGTSGPRYLEEYAEVALTGVASHFETHYAPLDRHFEISVAPWGDRGFAAIFTDVTARKRAEEGRAQLEENLVQVRKLESIGQLAGGVAHDLNNMLAPILGYAEILLLEMPDRHPRRAELGEIFEAASRARDLTRQLLAFARKQTLEVKPLDLNRLIADLIRLLRRTIRENISIETHFGQSLGLIEGDLGQIEQILLNLAANAQDAMPEGGVLVIETCNFVNTRECTEIHKETVEGPHVMITVSDTGIGMDRRTLERMFDPFFTTKELGRGTGLGLATVYGIVKQHGGHIWAESEPGEGTIFRLAFPRCRARPEPGTPPVRRGEVKGAETILVVEDQDEVRAMVREMLRIHGYSILDAPDGESALRLAASHEGPIDLLVTDVIMTGIDGKELYQRLRDIRPNVAVLFMSGYPADVIGRRGLLEAEVHFIQKPFVLVDFMGKVREVLDAK